MSKKALGKGIGALFRDLDERQGEQGLQEVPLNAVKPNPNQPRQEFSEDSLRELADSIREKGVIQPILVELESPGTYSVVAGERRLKAARLAGLDTIPVLLKQLSAEEKIEVALIENIQREGLTPIEEARGYQQLMDLGRLNQEEVARKVGKKRSTVANAVRLLKLPEEMQRALSKGNLSPGHARAILSVTNPEHRQSLFQTIQERDLSVRQAEAESARLNSGGRPDKIKRPVKPKRRVPELEEIEQGLIELLGTKVKVSGSLTKGRLEISYYSADDLSALMERFGLTPDDTQD